MAKETSRVNLKWKLRNTEKVLTNTYEYIQTTLQWTRRSARTRHQIFSGRGGRTDKTRRIRRCIRQNEYRKDKWKREISSQRGVKNQQVTRGIRIFKSTQYIKTIPKQY